MLYLNLLCTTCVSVMHLTNVETHKGYIKVDPKKIPISYALCLLPKASWQSPAQWMDHSVPFALSDSLLQDVSFFFLNLLYVWIISPDGLSMRHRVRYDVLFWHGRTLCCSNSLTLLCYRPDPSLINVDGSFAIWLQWELDQAQAVVFPFPSYSDISDWLDELYSVFKSFCLLLWKARTNRYSSGKMGPV